MNFYIYESWEYEYIIIISSPTWCTNDISDYVYKEKLKGTFKIDKEEKVKVPAGDFDAFPVSSDDLDANGMKVAFKTYFAKNTGMVKQVIKIGAQEVVIELEKYEDAK